MLNEPFNIDKRSKKSKRKKWTTILSLLGIGVTIAIAIFQSSEKESPQITVDNRGQVINNDYRVTNNNVSGIGNNVTNNNGSGNSNNVTNNFISTIDSSNSTPKQDGGKLNETPPQKINYKGFTIFSFINGKYTNRLSEELSIIFKPKLDQEDFIYSQPINKDCFKTALYGDVSCIANRSLNQSVRYIVLVDCIEQQHEIQSYKGAFLVNKTYNISIVDNQRKRLVKTFEYENKESGVNIKTASNTITSKFLDSVKSIYIQI